MVVTHDLADDLGAFHVRTVTANAHFLHRPEDAAVHRLQAVASIRDGSGGDDRHGVVDERPLHLDLWLDGFDTGPGLFFRGLVAAVTIAVLARHQASTSAYVAFFSMNPRRCTTSSPVKMLMIASAIAAS